MHRAHREAAGKGIAEEDRGSISFERAAGRSDDDSDDLRITGGERERGDPGFIAKLREEERDERREEDASLYAQWIGYA